MSKNIHTLLMMMLSAMTCHAEGTDTLRMVMLDEVSVETTIKENGMMRQQAASVSLVGKEQLNDNHITSLKGVSNIVPNLFIPDYGSRLTSAVYIRGIGSRMNTPAVGLYVDNIPYIDKSAFDFNFYDIERVDVIRGPQGTLYGRNTMGGLMRVYTKNPFSYEGTDLKLGWASGDNHRNVAVTHNHRISDKFAFSAGGYYEGGDGFFKNDLTGKNADGVQSGGGRLRGIYKSNERLSFDFSVSYDYSDERAYPYYFTGTLEGEEPYATSIGRITNNRESSYRRGLLNVGLNTQYRTDKWQMNAVTSYQDIDDRMFMDQDFLSPDIYTLEQRQKVHTFNEEVTFKNTEDSRWKWVTGANFMYQTMRTKAPVTFYEDGLRWLESNINTMMPSIDNIAMLKMMGFEGMGVNFRGDKLAMAGTYDTPALGMALFHQSTFSITDQLSLSAGVRFDYEHQQLKYASPADVMYGFRMPNSQRDYMNVNLQELKAHINYDGKMNHDRFCVLPKVSLKYDFDKYNNIYASVAMGQRSGGYNLQMFNELLQGALRVDMIDGVKNGVGGYLDYLASIEGTTMPPSIPDMVKGIMDENMPKFNVPTTSQVVYKPEHSWNYELGTHLTLAERSLMLDASVFYNRIYNQQIARFAPSGYGRMMVNAGKSQSCGGELSMRWMPNEHLSLIGNYGYTHAAFLEYDDGQGNDYEGKHVPFVPAHSVNADAAYTWVLGKEADDDWWKVSCVTLGANCTGTGKIYWTENNAVSQPLFVNLGARLSVNTSHLTLTLWGKNLADSKYNTFYFESAGRGFEQHCKPLQVGIDLNVRL